MIEEVKALLRKYTEKTGITSTFSYHVWYRKSIINEKLKEEFDLSVHIFDGDDGDARTALRGDPELVFKSLQLHILKSLQPNIEE